MKTFLAFSLVFFAAAVAFGDPLVTNPTGVGTQFGTKPTQGLGFHGATPVPQRSGAAQTAVTSTATTTLAATSASNSSPYGFTTSTQANALVTLVNQLKADNANLATLVNELRAALVQKGLIAGQ
jgi:hypothetical protein